jgi:short subunit dehydrogenase-like uncharacterized protein
MVHGARTFDLILYGATGFTGKLVAGYLAERQHGLRWAIAGRDREKLAHLAKAIGQPDLPQLVADSQEQTALDEMAAMTRLVISTAGPYHLHGMPIASACARLGTDYVNISGEPLFAHDLIRDYQGIAEESGARLMISAGFDSIPAELGVWLLQDHAITTSGKPLRHVSNWVREFNGDFSGGTVASGKLTRSLASDDEVRRRLLDPFVLTRDFRGPKQPIMHKVRQDQTSGQWLAPFMMAPINSKNLHLSNYLQDLAYGEDFTYEEMQMAGAGEAGRANAEALASYDLEADPEAPNPGEGPSAERQAAGSFEFLVTGQTQDGKTLSVVVSGNGDPGYLGTSRMVVETAILMLENPYHPRGGVWVPAAAFKGELVKRLEQFAPLRFEVQDD